METLRGETQDARFDVETVSHKLKFYKTLCTIQEEKKATQTSFIQSAQLLIKNTAILSNFHPQQRKDNFIPMKKAPRLKLSKKSKKDEDDQESDSEEEENELRICGTKCRNVPPTVRAEFIKTMFAD